jgi:predicted NAD/FAD-binding protein
MTDTAEAYRKHVAVIGGGVAGIVAAHLLQKTHRVNLFEQGDYLGGHIHTIPIPDGPGTPAPRSIPVHRLQ